MCVRTRDEEVQVYNRQRWIEMEGEGEKEREGEREGGGGEREREKEGERRRERNIITKGMLAYHHIMKETLKYTSYVKSTASVVM